MFSKLGLQMFTVRDHIGDEAALDKTFERMAEIGYTEAQTAGRESAEYAKIAKKHGITIVGTHYSYEEIINNVDATIKLHEALGTTNVGIGAMPYAAIRRQKYTQSRAISSPTTTTRLNSWNSYPARAE